ncbi:TrkH family potassium uptake protein [Parasporobacterium paucivorans]|uniref:Trk system potassium uptake protein TrkH n=1 Tax=Parasporobacterium paucivorans DSM 15970 TaxID=1122934 RepID=A0A1M6HPD8_9FIRM|nr:TrkH family potassium uptake protein [Parasporobacterium paucivorans]SHJ24030.1 trk system potassium uptake protein TrkH [Parasporobacterium paucivorans DSM 15970]
MNFSIIRYILGNILYFEAAFLVLPCITALIYREEQGFAYLVVLAGCLVAAFIITRFKPKRRDFYTKEGFATVSLTWILISIVGAIPFVITGEISFAVDALFEIVSGFTTTGSSILTNVEALSHTSLIWRSFSHWIGGMGILVFVLTILPMVGGHNMYMIRAESPGPSVEKLVPKIRKSASLLYIIYIVLTLAQIILLLAGRMPAFDAICTTFGTAGTGGFGIKNNSMAGYSDYVQIVTTVFMILFGVNFSVYFLFVMKRFKQGLKSEEVRTYLLIIAVSIALITANVRESFPSLHEAVQHVAFSVASVITTTGFATADFNAWPTFSKGILVTIMFIGACAGSTGGGLKVSRIILLIKGIKKEMQLFLHPRSVKVIKFEGKPIQGEMIRATCIYFVAYVFLFAISVLLVSFDGFSTETSFTAVVATMNNIGPGMDMVGPTGNFSEFSAASKIVMTFDMLAGRLELFPILLLFVPSTWKRS